MEDVIASTLLGLAIFLGIGCAAALFHIISKRYFDGDYMVLFLLLVFIMLVLIFAFMMGHGIRHG